MTPLAHITPGATASSSPTNTESPTCSSSQPTMSCQRQDTPWRSTPDLSVVKHWRFWFRKHCDLFLLYLPVLSSTDPFITQTGSIFNLCSVPQEQPICWEEELLKIKKGGGEGESEMRETEGKGEVWWDYADTREKKLCETMGTSNDSFYINTSCELFFFPILWFVWCQFNTIAFFILNSSLIPSVTRRQMLCGCFYHSIKTDF